MHWPFNLELGVSKVLAILLLLSPPSSVNLTPWCCTATKHQGVNQDSVKHIGTNSVITSAYTVSSTVTQKYLHTSNVNKISKC